MAPETCHCFPECSALTDKLSLFSPLFRLLFLRRSLYLSFSLFSDCCVIKSFCFSLFSFFSDHYFFKGFCFSLFFFLFRLLFVKSWKFSFSSLILSIFSDCYFLKVSMSPLTPPGAIPPVQLIPVIPQLLLGENWLINSP